jgi:hypothetical protein
MNLIVVDDWYAPTIATKDPVGATLVVALVALE